MRNSHARLSSSTHSGAAHHHQHEARATPDRQGQWDRDPDRPWAYAVIGARGDDLPRPQPTDDPHSADGKETTAIKALALIAKHWQLSDQQTACLLDADAHVWQTLRDSVRPLTEQDGAADTSSNLECNSKHLHHPQRDAPRSEMVYRCADHVPQRTSLSKEQLARISILYYMYVSLYRLFTPDIADRWVSCGNNNPVFGGMAPIDVMIEGGLPKIREARNYINAKMWG